MAGAVDLFAGRQPIAGVNLFKTDKNPLNQLDMGIEDVIGEQGWLSGSQVTGSLQTILNAILGFDINGLEGMILGDNSLNTYFGNVETFLGELNPLDPNFDPVAAIENFIGSMLKPTNMLAMLITDASQSAGVTGFIPLENLAMDLI